MEPRLDATVTDSRGDDAIGAVSQFAAFRQRGTTAASFGRLPRDIALSRFLVTSGFNWDNVDGEDDIREGEHLNAHLFGVFSIDGHAERIFINGKTQVYAQGAWKMHMTQCGKLTTHRSHVYMDTPFFRDLDEHNYAVMLGTSIRDHIDVHWRALEILSFYLLDVPHNGLPFRTWP